MISSEDIHSNTRMTKHSKILSSLERKWFLLLWSLLFAKVIRCDDQPPPSTPAAAGLLCTSECARCSVICSPSPSPSPVKPKSPPPSPPRPLLMPPSPPVHHYSPPQPYYFHAPPPSLLPKPLPPESSPPPPPPPSYISWSNATPPPPFNYYFGGGGGNIPSIQVPPGMGQRNYSYPYYYFYASKATSFAPQGSSLFVFVLLSVHAFCFS